MKYSWKKTGIKVAKMLLIYGVPWLLNEFTVRQPYYANLTISGGLHLLWDIAKHKWGIRLP